MIRIFWRVEYLFKKLDFNFKMPFSNFISLHIKYKTEVNFFSIFAAFFDIEIKLSTSLGA